MLAFKQTCVGRSKVEYSYLVLLEFVLGGVFFYFFLFFFLIYSNYSCVIVFELDFIYN